MRRVFLHLLLLAFLCSHAPSGTIDCASLRSIADTASFFLDALNASQCSNGSPTAFQWLTVASDADTIARAPSYQSLDNANLLSHTARDMAVSLGYGRDNPHRDAFMAFCSSTRLASSLFCFLELARLNLTSVSDESDSLARAEAVRIYFLSLLNLNLCLLMSGLC